MNNYILKRAYVFDLHLTCSGYAYFSTFTIWITFNNDGREVRKPSTVNTKNFIRSLDHLGLTAFFVLNEWDYDYWLLHRGWAIVPSKFAHSKMKHWLNTRECLKGPYGTYTDITISAPFSLKHSILKHQRKSILQRDSGRCLICGATGPNVKLTIHHVQPYSHSGETTYRNLVCLCENCNQNLSNRIVKDLYNIAGLHNGYDKALIKGEITRDAIEAAFDLSDNLMHTRCEIY